MTLATTTATTPLAGDALIVTQAIADHFGVTLAAILSPGRGRARIAFARHVAMAAVRRLPGPPSYPDIAEMFGRDHTTAMYGVERVEAMAETDPEVARLLLEVTGRSCAPRAPRPPPVTESMLKFEVEEARRRAFDAAYKRARAPKQPIAA